MISLVEEKRAAEMRQARDAKAPMVRAVSIGVCLVLLSAAVVCSALYGWATYRIGKLGLQEGRQPLEGPVSVRGIRTISTGMAMTRAAMVRELDDSGFTVASSGGEKPDTYSLVGDNMLRLHGESGLLRLHFRSGKIDRMQDEKNDDLEAVQIPSPVLFRMHAREDLTAAFSERQFFATEQELKGSVIPDVLLGVEDKDYMRSGGVEPMSILAALLDAARGAKMRGAGTIDQQLGRTLLWPDENLSAQSHTMKFARKVAEWFLASALNRRLSKEKLLLDYCNVVDTGSMQTASGQWVRLRGFKAAAFFMWGIRDLSQLTLSQAATLVAILPRPNHLLTHPDELRRRRDEVVLSIYSNLHPEKKAAALNAMKDPLNLVRIKDDEGDSQRASLGFFMDGWQAGPELKSESWGAGGLNLSVDPILQYAAASALQDEIAQLRLRGVPTVEGAVVAMDPETGQVRALVGGDRFPALNAARQSYRTGSAAKPFYYARALEEGSVNGEPLTSVTPLNLADCAIGAWQPNDGESGGYLSTRAALAKSSDCGAVVVAKGLGLQKACDAIRLALQNHPVCNGGPELLGGAAGSEASPLHLAQAYAAFANGGERVEAQFMQTRRKATNRTRLFSPQAAFVATSLMVSVMRNGTGAQALAWSGLPKNAAVAGKTGTSGNGSNKLWIAVVQPRLIVVVMISAGSDKALTEQAGYTGGLIAGKVYGGFLRRSSQAAPFYFGGEFQQPPGVKSLEVDRLRGCLQPGTRDYETFLVDRVPPACS